MELYSNQLLKNNLFPPLLPTLLTLDHYHYGTLRWRRIHNQPRTNIMPRQKAETERPEHSLKSICENKHYILSPKNKSFEYKHPDKAHLRVCVCAHVLNRRLYLIFKWVKQEIATTRKPTLNQAMAITLRNHILIKEQGVFKERELICVLRASLFPYLAVLFRGAEQINCLHFPSLTATSFRSSPCFCFFTCLSHSLLLWSGPPDYWKSSTFISSPLCNLTPSLWSP